MKSLLFKSRLLKSLAIAFLLTITSHTGAQAGCANRSTQLAMNKCADKVYKSRDRRMNRVYRMALKAQSRNHKSALRKAQRSWLAYRNKACKSYSYLGEGGTIRPLMYSHCLSQLTSERTKMLQLQTIGMGS